MAAWENGSEQQLEQGKDGFCHPPSSTFFSNGSCHDEKVSIGCRNITNLRLADDIDALAEEQQELEALVDSLDKTCTRYKMKISAEKTKLMTNSANGIQRVMKVKGQTLGTVTSFKYLEAIVSDDGSKKEVLSRIAQATSALITWYCNKLQIPWSNCLR